MVTQNLLSGPLNQQSIQPAAGTPATPAVSSLPQQQNIAAAAPVAPATQSIEQQALGGGGQQNKQQVSNFMNALNQSGSGQNNNFMNAQNANQSYQNIAGMGINNGIINPNTTVAQNSMTAGTMGGPSLTPGLTTQAPLIQPNTLMPNTSTPGTFAPVPTDISAQLYGGPKPTPPQDFYGNYSPPISPPPPPLQQNPWQMTADRPSPYAYDPIQNPLAVTKSVTAPIQDPLAATKPSFIDPAAVTAPTKTTSSATPIDPTWLNILNQTPIHTNYITDGSMPTKTFSDENLKTNINPADDKMQEFLNKVGAHNYEYKSEKHGIGTFTSPMAQELEATELGKQAVINTPEGKMVDYARLGGVNLAAVSVVHREQLKLQKQVDQLRKEINQKRKK